MALGRSPEPIWFPQLTTAQALAVAAAQAQNASKPGYAR